MYSNVFAVQIYYVDTYIASIQVVAKRLAPLVNTQSDCWRIMLECLPAEDTQKADESLYYIPGSVLPVLSSAVEVIEPNVDQTGYESCLSVNYIQSSYSQQAA